MPPPSLEDRMYDLKEHIEQERKECCRGGDAFTAAAMVLLLMVVRWGSVGFC